MKKLFLLLPLLLLFSGCDVNTANHPRADEHMQRQQEIMQQQQISQTGMPGITNFTEAKLVKHLYELRDQKIVTYSYVPDMQGKLWHLCDSIGYGLPYAVQFSNPEKNVWTDGEGNHTWVNTNLPQAEPNGLYMPSAAEGTWITCINPNGSGDLSPLYVEPRVIVSPFKLRAEGEYALK